MDAKITELQEEAEAYSKKWSKKDRIPISLYGGMGAMGALAIWVVFSALNKKEKEEDSGEEYIDERGNPVPTAEVRRMRQHGEVELLDMES